MRVSIKDLLQKMNDFCTQALHAAAGRCVARGQQEVLPEHLVLELVAEARGDWGLMLAGKGVAMPRVRKALEGYLEGCASGSSSRPVFAPPLLALLQDAWLVASIDLGATRIRSGAILVALLDRLPRYPSGGPLDLLKGLGREALLGEFNLLTARSVESPGETGDGSQALGKDAFLERFCLDFTHMAREGKIDPVFGRDAEIRQIIDILARRRKNNPICVGDPGVGKTAVVEGLALRIVEGDVPEILQGVTLLALDMGLLEAGAGMKGEFESRLKGVIQEITHSSQPIILFVDEAHTLIGAGGTPGGSDASNLLKPALARGELRTIAATTWTEYKKYFEKDPALARRFQVVNLNAPSVAATLEILRGIRPHYERAHQVVVRDDALVAAAELADRHINGRFLPDKAIDLLDTSCARIKVGLTAQPAALEDKIRQCRVLERERTILDRDCHNGVRVDGNRLKDLDAAIGQALQEAADLERRWVEERQAVARLLGIRNRIAEAGEGDLLALRDEAMGHLKAVQEGRGLLPYEVDPDVVAKVVSDWTGVPLGKLLKDEASGLLELEERLGARIKGQDEALRAIAEVLQAAKAGLRPSGQPLGVFLLVGPSGTGKTETALALADLLFGSERNLVAINLSEFQEGHSVSRLLGSPPGYVGYGEGGMLTEAVRQRPYSVVLLDEGEKAHGDVLNLFHQMFDKGVLTDGEGKEVSFRNTVIMVTSNLAAEAIRELGSRTEMAGVELAGAIRPALTRAFKTSLLARMTVVPFLPLDANALRSIVALKLERLRARAWSNNRMALNFTPALVDLLADRCACQDMGARAIDAILDSEVLPRLSREILGRLDEGHWPPVSLVVGEEGQVAFAFPGDPARITRPD